MKKSFYLTFVILVCAISLTFAMGGGGGASSQKNHRGFEGKVTDENGKNLKGVEISLIAVDATEVEQVKDSTATNDKNDKKNLNTVTGNNGKYRFIAVRPGFYRVRYSVEGYQTLEKLMEFKRGSKDAVLNVKLHAIGMEATSANQP